MEFKLLTTDPKSKARAGELLTDHGVVPTPIFMPVGTLGGVKAVHMRELRDDVKASIMLSNTYHLYLRPGMEVIEHAGGLHKFNGWDGPILTDSGGFQVHSLSDIRKITEEGVKFSSHIDGSKHLFTPENVMDIQRTIGADIMMAFDECTPWPCEIKYATDSMHRTHRWLDRCFDRFTTTEPKYGHEQALFPIVQGSTFPELRKASSEYIAKKGAYGNAIGGLSVGEPEEEMYAMAELCCDILPKDRPRYLMGVGTPWNLLENMAIGIDMFDCVMPTRNGRNGMLFTREGVVQIKNKVWADDHSPLDPNGTSFVDSAYSKAFVRHLFVTNELLGLQIASLHNLAFYVALMTEARGKILDGTFSEWKAGMLPKLKTRISG
ncbi:MAG: tRNA guanosine(34) transglycosylase Tgt [Flavobacteriales bacterium]|jgi:queuine tRNA-ribosyltransferase|nr:tRNA guanosine(34) transglycosylase Tgt [Flavobacteriales bacterium]MBK9599265.1 tRNA guanosine(34) transglycosylase Tgt [Flavobacteriales bacterium]QQS74292.1 MAG: tRNA guanosine(34) transglycosylase Tgt [Flavobacteriales bacterium]HQV39085.1 tRNA guanosine(34) transglycosylase Tgt [Flavobacteriales bacterium]HQW32786.1 tRNA guanosine(34) transglycosylase Tgt [Flavobacteriales bacterium]